VSCVRKVSGTLKHPLVGLAAILFFLPYILVLLGATVSLATEVLIFALLGLGFNILLGYTGLVSFGHGAYFGLATYAAALTQLHLCHGMVVPLLFGVLTGGLLGAVVGFLIMRKRGVYFALLTLAFTQMFFYIVYRATSVTGGENGLGGIERFPIRFPHLFAIDISDPSIYYYFVYGIFLVAIYLIWKMVHSPFGCVLQAIRENDERARCVGYDTKRYRYVAFIISCAFAGLAGSLYVFLLRFAYPESVGWIMGGDILAMTVVGGMKSFFGPVVGATFFIFLRDILTSYTEHWLVVFGGLFMVFILFSPQGIAGIIQKIFPGSERVLGLRFLYHDVGSGSQALEGQVDSIYQAGEVRGSTLRRSEFGGEELLVCRGLVRRFGAFAAVERMDLVVRKGEFHSIIGPNGAGKTTLFNCLTGLLPLSDGQMVFKGEDISRLPVHGAVSRGIARSFQITSVFNELTVFENIRIAVQAVSAHKFDLFARTERLSRIKEEARNIILEVGLSGKERVVASSLSHGDQRLLEIGIALATRPELLLLDEPLAGLSTGESARITEFIRKLGTDVTILLIEHKIESVLALSSKITVMHRGEVIAEGSPEEIERNVAVQQAYLGEVRLESTRKKAAVPLGKEESMFRTDRLNTYYGKSHILHNVSMCVDEGEVVCLLGRNGAGKTTTLRSIIGTTRPRSGNVYFKQQNIAGLPPEEIAQLGIGLVPQGRRIFPNLTVAENLLIANRGEGDGGWNLERVFSHFRKLGELRNSRGETLSGGERQMLAIARSLMGNVHLLLLDGPFEGLAPTIVAEVADIIEEIRSHTTILLVEQNATLALALADRAYVLSNGEIAFEGNADELACDEALKKALLGV